MSISGRPREQEPLEAREFSLQTLPSVFFSFLFVPEI
jgi:hypothetical protein